MINEEFLIYYGIGAVFLIILFYVLFKKKKVVIKEDTTKEVTVNYSTLMHKPGQESKSRRRSIMSQSSNFKNYSSNIDEVVKWTESTSYQEDSKKISNYEDNLIGDTNNQINKDDYRLNILLVDDSLVVRKYISDLLIGYDYNVITKNDGAEGLEYLNTTLLKPDLIISDIEMPVMDGFTFITKLREEQSNVEIPILVISAHAESHFSLMSEGKIQGFIKKPFSNEDLVKQINYLLGL